MAFDKRRTWKQVKDLEADAFRNASGVFHERWLEHQNPEDLIRRDKLAVASTHASLSGMHGPPPPPGTPSLMDRVKRPRKPKPPTAEGSNPGRERDRGYPDRGDDGHKL